LEDVVRHNWISAEVDKLYALPFMDLLYTAQTVHRRHFVPNTVQIATLLSIKTGACPEDCAYCSQSARYNTGLQREKLMDADTVIAAAKRAKTQGASRFCMGTAWRSPPREKDFVRVLEMVKAVKALGMETCVTLGMLDETQAQRLKTAGLDYYNHNLDTSPEYYQEIISTRTYQDRLTTLKHVRQANLKTCCGGIIGMGEARSDRVGLLLQLANLPEHPPSVPINQLVPVKGTPLGDTKPLDVFEFIRTVAAARIMMPCSIVRLSAGRESMSPEAQALCFLAGANSIFYGDTLLTAANAETTTDDQLLKTLNIQRLSSGSMALYVRKTSTESTPEAV